MHPSPSPLLPIPTEPNGMDGREWHECRPIVSIGSAPSPRAHRSGCRGGIPVINKWNKQEMVSLVLLVSNAYNSIGPTAVPSRSGDKKAKQSSGYPSPDVDR